MEQLTRRLRLAHATQRIAVLALSGVWCGCGGGGGGSAGPTVPLSTNLRRFQQGDAWTYSFVGSVKQFDGSELPETGSLKVTVSAVNGAQVTFSDSSSMTVQGTTVQAATIYLFDQNAATGALTPISYTTEGQPTITVSNATYYTPGIFAAGTDVSGTVTYSNGVTDTETLMTNTTTPNLEVQTSFANFETWQIGIVESGTDGTSLKETEEYAPALGRDIEATINTSDSSGNQGSGTFMLTSTTIPSSEWGGSPEARRN